MNARDRGLTRVKEQLWTVSVELVMEQEEFFKTLRQGNTIYQTQAVCDACAGKCYVIPDTEKCKKCSGDKVVKDSKIYTVDIERGMKWGDSVTFYGEADQTPGATTGDIVFHLDKKKNDDATFRREGNDLYCTHNLQLIEALTGFKFLVTHLDGRKICVANQPLEIVSPGETLKVPDQGFSIKNRPEQFGDLYITFTVIFPQNLTGNQSKQLKGLFPTEDLKVDPNIETVHTYKVMEQQKNRGAKSQRGGGEAYDDDEQPQGRGGPGGVECQQQ